MLHARRSVPTALFDVSAFACTSRDVTCSVLGTFFFELGGGGWVNHSGWVTAAVGVPTSYCSFFRVRCSDGDVTALCVGG